jgi:hypothetical protein
VALTVKQLRDRDALRRALAVPPDPDPSPPVTAVPVGVFVGQEQPTDVAVGSLWIPLNPDGTPQPVDQWQVLT